MSLARFHHRGFTFLIPCRQYPQLLMKLSPLFHDQKFVNITDNACGAVSRMILSRSHAVPLEQVLPVLFQALPLKKDFLENEPVFQCIHYLFEAKHPVVMQSLAQLLPIFAQVLGDEKQSQKPATRQHISQMVKSMATTDTVAFQSWMGVLQLDQQALMMNMLR